MRKGIIVRIITTLLLVTLFVFPSAPAWAASKSKVISKKSTSNKIIALTFDDGYSGEKIDEILEILVEYDIKATFFMTGSAMKANPNQMKSLLEHGNIIANHSYSHPYFTGLSTKKIQNELDKTEAVYEKITGQSLPSLFRPPCGDYNTRVLQTLGNAGYSTTIYWTIDPMDWKGISAKKITDRVLSKASPGAIVLLHAGGGAVNTPAALPDIIQGLKAKGYEFVTILELLEHIDANDTSISDSKDSINPDNNSQNHDNKNIEHSNQQQDSQIVINPVPNTNTIKYVVKKGDTLSKISRRYGVSVKDLAAANRIKDINLIYINQVISIPLKPNTN